VEIGLALIGLEVFGWRRLGANEQYASMIVDDMSVTERLSVDTVQQGADLKPYCGVISGSWSWKVRKRLLSA
jgi:hypothetical protein